METIYSNNFLNYLEDRLGHVKTTSKNYIVPCPWCEVNKKQDHYHLYISIDTPIFHCFHAGCEQKGTLKKLLQKIEGYDITDKFVDKEKIKKFATQKINLIKQESKIQIPTLNTDNFKLKETYLKGRLKYTRIPTESIKGLVFDINQFIEMNQIPVDPTLFRIRDYLQSNFVGFLTENKSTLICRNINSQDEFRYYKLKVAQTYFPDYYKLKGDNKNSNTVVVAEGIFDIFTEYLFDSTNNKQNCSLYATALSANYAQLLKSIAFNEGIYRMNVVVLSDRGIERDTYKKLKNYNIHIIDKLTVYYNENGKDFNVTPIIPIKIVIE
jgi:hypothetical protein